MRLIDADLIVSKLKNKMVNPQTVFINTVLLGLIDEAPTVDAVEVVHGRWEKHGKHDWRCSVCEVGVPYSYTGHNYCPNCGAKMDGTE